MTAFQLEARKVVKILWVHNFPPGHGGTFMRDILEAPVWNQSFEIVEHVVPVNPGATQFLSLIKTVRAAARNCDIVHAQFGSFVGLVSAFSGKPLVISVRGSDFYHHPEQGLRGWLKSKLRQTLTYFAMQKASLIVCMSNRNRHEIVNLPGLRLKQVEVLADPAGKEFWSCDIVSVRQNVEAYESKVLFASLNKSNPVKRSSLARLAAELVKKVGVNLSLVVIENKTRADVAAEMKSCSAVLLTSVYEGWPNIIKEALLLQVPFVATDVSDLSDYTKHDNRNRIVSSSVLGVACGLVESHYAKALEKAKGPVGMVSFFPDVVSRKLQCAYLCVMDGVE